MITTDICVVVKISVLNCKSLKYPLKRVVFLVVSCGFSSNKKISRIFFLFPWVLCKIVLQSWCLNSAILLPNHSLRVIMGVAILWEKKQLYGFNLFWLKLSDRYLIFRPNPRWSYHEKCTASVQWFVSATHWRCSS